MQFRRRDSGFIIVLALCVLAIWPFLRYASLPHDTDAELHIFRLAELARMWQGGIVYPRWAANFYYGFGYPIFNFYAPLTYYIALLFNLLPGFDPVASTKVVLLLGIIGAGMGMYGFVRDQFGRTAAFVAAASYVYAPYILYIDPHARGVLPESFAFAVFPCALWSVDKLLRRPSGKRFLAAVSLLAAIILTHNLMAMVFGSLTFAYFVWLLMVGIGTGERLSGVGIRLTLLAFGLGVGVAAFFWLPMVLEQNAIQIASVIGEGSHYDFRNHFMTLGELFGGMPRFDWGASQPYFKHSLGIMQWVLGLLGFGRILFTRSLRRKQALFFAIIAISLIFLMLPQSLWLWRTIPVLPFLQFPWRLLGATNAMLAVLAGFLFADLSPTEPSTQPTQPQNPLLAATVIGLILLMALPLMQIKPWSNFGDTNAQAVLASELAGRWRGTTSTADFVPATVDVTPREQPQITRQIQQGLPIDPLNRETLGDAQVETEIISPTHFRFQVQTQQELVLRL
ncbi:MAG TPA: hypothetical protein ENJ56_08015, partial [Anaerolineae bacterium]|nr:hypothetical protein [Anaerolineae bacterium]